jgi:hypothetical protein
MTTTTSVPSVVVLSVFLAAVFGVTVAAQNEQVIIASSHYDITSITHGSMADRATLLKNSYRRRHRGGHSHRRRLEDVAGEDLEFIEEADACDAATIDFLSAVPVVADASDVYIDTMVTAFPSDDGAGGGGDGDDGDSVFNYSDFLATHDTDQLPDMSIGFPADAEATFRKVCEENGGFWSAVEDELFFCQEDGLVETMSSVWVHGMGDCLASIGDCQNLDPIMLLEDVWDELNLDCRLAEDGETIPPVSMEMEEEEVMDEATAFLPPDDAACMDATETFVEGTDEAFQTSIDNYMDSQELDMDDPQTSQMSMGYADEAAATMKASCENAGGYWSIIESEQFICEFEGIEQSLNVYNFGSCLATTEECKAMDIGHILESVWDVMGLTCWSSNETKPEIDGLDLTEEDLACLSDTNDLADTSNELSDASSVYADKMTIDQDDDSGDMKLSFPEDAVSEFRAACDTAGGLFSLVVSQGFTCTKGALSFNVDVNNMGDCLADTTECQNMDPIQLLESVWDSMDLQCEVTGETGGSGAGDEEVGPETGGGDNESDNDEDDGNDQPDTIPGDDSEGDNDTGDNDAGGDGDGSESGPDTEEPDQGSNEATSSPGNSAESEAVGMSPEDASCMEASMGLIENSETLESAEATYAKAMEMDDPKKIGYSSEAARTMKSVCEEEGGYWSAIVSEDVTCDMNGHMRRINVYNFGNCVAATDDCKAMDPIVLVKGFFWEIMKFRCWKSDEDGSDTYGGSGGDSHSGGGGGSHNGSGHHTGGGMPDLGGQQQSSLTAATPTDTDTPPAIPVAVAVVVLVLAGFGLFIWRRQRTGRERIPSRRAYEMTDVSDLRFDTLT